MKQSEIFLFCVNFLLIYAKTFRGAFLNFKFKKGHLPDFWERYPELETDIEPVRIVLWCYRQFDHLRSCIGWK